jgi:hypothetical protein
MSNETWYIVYRDRSMVIDHRTAAYRSHVVVGPFADKAAIQQWIETQIAPTYYGYANYVIALNRAEIYWTVGEHDWVQRYIERYHTLTPDAALPFVRNMARLRDLILTAPAAPVATKPNTLWDMLDDEQEGINE